MDYFWWIFIIVLISQSAQRSGSQMGPKLYVEPEEFLKIATQSNNLVIKTKTRRGLWSSGYASYVVRQGDYYYQTTSSKPLDLPSTCAIQEVKFIL